LQNEKDGKRDGGGGLRGQFVPAAIQIRKCGKILYP